MRIVLAFLVGVICGAGAVVYLLQSDAADFFIRKTQVVERLEQRLQDVESQRNDLVRQLTEVSERAGRMETAFGEMEKRFRALQDEMERGRRAGEAAPAPGATP